MNRKSIDKWNLLEPRAEDNIAGACLVAECGHPRSQLAF